MTEVGGYELLGMIGAGSSATVWQARPAGGRSLVALKRLRLDPTPDAVAGLRREAALVASVRHPNVVRVLDVIADGDGIALVLDHAPNGSLSSLLHRRGWLAPGELVAVVTPLASALAAVHAVGLAHGDVRPPNVLFAADGRPLLADFGLAGQGDDGRLVGLRHRPVSDAIVGDVDALVVMARGAAGPPPLPAELDRVLARTEARPSPSAFGLADGLRTAVPSRSVRLPPTAPVQGRAPSLGTATDGPPTPVYRAGRMHL